MTEEALWAMITRLRALAKNTPSGAWNVSASSGYQNPSVITADGPLFSTGNARARTYAAKLAAATYVAAVDPQTMVLLCDAVERLILEQQAVIQAIDNLTAATK